MHNLLDGHDKFACTSLDQEKKNKKETIIPQLGHYVIIYFSYLITLNFAASDFYMLIIAGSNTGMDSSHFRICIDNFS